MFSRTCVRICSFAAAIGCLLALTLCNAGSAQGQTTDQRYAGSGRLRDHVAPQVLNGIAVKRDHYGSDKMLRLALAIAPPHMAEEEQFLVELNTKGSANFHKFLTPEEWNSRFAPSQEDEQKVVTWAESQGLRVTHRFKHRLVVDVEGTVEAIEKAFGVTIDNYQVGDEVDFANSTDPVLPAALQGVLYSVQGLNNIQREQSARADSNKAKGEDYSPGPPYKMSGSSQGDGDPSKMPASMSGNTSAAVANGGVSNGSATPRTDFLSPANLFSSQVYNYAGLTALGHCCNPYNNANGSPNVSSIAIAAFGNFNGSDIVGFQAGYPYLAYNYTAYNIDGTIDCTKASNAGACPSGETTQDLEWSLATANSFGSSNNTAHVYVYVGANFNNKTFTDMYSYMLDDNTARVMTTSWSCTEVYQCSTSTMDSRHTIFNMMVGSGWTLIAASGDRGSADDCSFNKTTQTENTAHFSVAYPASDYDVVAAGGTSLQVYTDFTFDYEYAWSGGTYNGACGRDNNGGSGGGVSSYYGKPSWQNSFGGTKRLTPDLSLNASGVGQNLYFNGSWGGSANGTSVSAPELAGFFAQENSYLNAIGNKCGTGGSACAPVGNPMPYVYAAGVYNDNAHNPFYDITSGCNSNDATVDFSLGSYCAHTGYDLVTGWGSANMMQLAWAINWQLIPASGIPNTVFSGPATNHWYNTNQTVSWSINDYNGGGTYPATGIAGFTQGWDSIPGDATAAAHGGANDSFYSGPEFPNTSTGCLSLEAGGCGGGSGQGCHTVHVRGWNNQGQTTGNSTYGPVCLDTVTPTVAEGTSPALPGSGYYKTAVRVSLAAGDPGGNAASGIAQTYYSVDYSYCFPGFTYGCSTYNGPITVTGDGYHYVRYFTQDGAGNTSSQQIATLAIDTTAPLTVANIGGGQINGTYSTSLNIQLSGGDSFSGVARTYYNIDGGATQTYPGFPIAYSTLGTHTINYYSVDNAGNTETAKSLTFTILSPTTVGLIASVNPANYGSPVLLTATVAATISGTPAGTVVFYSGSTNLGSAALVNGVATLTTTALPPGAQTLQASYPGAGNYRAGNSSPYNETVSKGNQTITFQGLGTQSVGFKLGITVAASSGLPVTMVSLTPSVCTIVGNQATLLAPGTCSIQGTQAGNSLWNAATPTTGSFNVVIGKGKIA